MTLDDATRSYLDRTGALSASKPYDIGPEAARAAMRARQLSDAAGPAVAHVDDTIVGPFDARVALRWFAPAAARSEVDPAVIVFLHGGGWVLGDLDGFDATARRMAVATGCEVALVDYRLAPEHPYPAAVEDAWRALLHVRDERPGHRIVVAGDSAGGNLAAVVALRARDGGIDLAAQVLVYPVVDAGFERTSFRDPENQLILDASVMMWFWDQYVPDRARRAEAEAAPLRAEHHAGLAPAVVVTAEHDVLCDEGEEYADVLDAAGVPVLRRRFAGQMHGFLGMAALPGSEQAMAYIAESTRTLLSARRAAISMGGAS